MKKLFNGVMAAAVLFCVAGCNTMRGAGEDVESAGKSIQKTVDKND